MQGNQSMCKWSDLHHIGCHVLANEGTVFRNHRERRQGEKALTIGREVVRRRGKRKI